MNSIFIPKSFFNIFYSLLVVVFLTIAEEEFSSVILKPSVEFEEGDTLKNVKYENSAFSNSDEFQSWNSNRTQMNLVMGMYCGNQGVVTALN